ncbi:DoxX family protein [Microbacterium marinilacus]|uniref:DoxX family protein n=1 Tax=Microbacterium marinilacus TaxID=415209 RepID=A0ABP7BM63_9MICO|nr:DoxX family protein [Microbacterium marinilacus]MBY0688302.1 DoxX family protein [Microbacterium marinilacus]
MLIALWIVNALAALLMLMAGSMKAIRSKDALRPQMAWVDDFSAGFVRFIGVVEVIGALGLVLPLATGIAPILTPIAATGLAIVMFGAVVVHIRRKEPFLPALVIALLVTASAVLGYLVVLG